MSENIQTRHAQVICPIHGEVGLTATEYHDQLMAYEDYWYCPTCEHIADFDFAFWAANHESAPTGEEFDDIPF